MGKGAEEVIRCCYAVTHCNVHLLVAQGSQSGSGRKSNARRVDSTLWNLREQVGLDKHNGEDGDEVLCWSEYEGPMTGQVNVWTDQY